MIHIVPTAIIGLVAAVGFPWPVVAGDAPAWRQPLPGTAAILGDDGGGEDQATVCDTTAHWRAMLAAPFPDAADGCARYPHGLSVVIEGVVSDPASDTIPSTTTALPLVNIRIPAKRVQGYVQMLGGIHPVIPPGTLVHLKAEGSSRIRLAPAQDAEMDDGPDLGGQATAKLLRYDPSTGDRDLYVTVLDGSLAGRSGWVFSGDAHGDDGKPIDMFASSVIEVPRQTPPIASRTTPPGTREWRGENGWEIIFAKMPGLSSAECSLAWNPPTAGHMLFWTWDNNINLSAGFIGPAPPGARAGMMTAVEPVVVSVDGRILTKRPSIDAIVSPLHDAAMEMIASSIPIAWDRNNPGHDTGLETGAIFDLLRHGRKLTIQVNGQTYTEDLSGIGSALALFPKCINYKEAGQ